MRRVPRELHRGAGNKMRDEAENEGVGGATRRDAFLRGGRLNRPLARAWEHRGKRHSLTE